MRLIDADAEIERLKNDFCKKCEKRKPYPIFGVGCCHCWIQDAVEVLEDAPEIEAEPVRHGRWIPHVAYEEYDIAYCDYVCSECGHEITKRLLCVPPRCENCGAKMDGDEE